MQQIDTSQAANDEAFFEAVEATLLMAALLLAIEEGEAHARSPQSDVGAEDSDSNGLPLAARFKTLVL